MVTCPLCPNIKVSPTLSPLYSHPTHSIPCDHHDDVLTTAEYAIQEVRELKKILMTEMSLHKISVATQECLVRVSVFDSGLGTGFQSIIEGHGKIR